MIRFWKRHFRHHYAVNTFRQYNEFLEEKWRVDDRWRAGEISDERHAIEVARLKIEWFRYDEARRQYDEGKITRRQWKTRTAQLNYAVDMLNELLAERETVSADAAS